jgi:hypothetical protein
MGCTVFPRPADRKTIIAPSQDATHGSGYADTLARLAFPTLKR